MIEAQTIYKTPDGKSFLTREQAEEHLRVGNLRKELRYLLRLAVFGREDGVDRRLDTGSYIWATEKHIEANLGKYLSLLQRWADATKDNRNG